MRTFTIAVFAAIGLAVVALDVVARSPRSNIATWGELVRRVVRSRPAQFGLLLSWWWIGVHFL